MKIFTLLASTAADCTRSSRHIWQVSNTGKPHSVLAVPHSLDQRWGNDDKVILEPEIRDAEEEPRSSSPYWWADHPEKAFAEYSQQLGIRCL